VLALFLLLDVLTLTRRVDRQAAANAYELCVAGLQRTGNISHCCSLRYLTGEPSSFVPVMINRPRSMAIQLLSSQVSPVK